MRTRNINTKGAALVALVALAIAVGAIWTVRSVRAFNPQPDPPGFGMVGIARGQTLRLNLVNITTPPDPNRQIPPPCRAVLSFRNAAGQPFTNSDGQTIRRVVELQAGESAFLDLNPDMLGGGTTNGGGDAATPLRLQLRPFVRVTQSPDPERGGFAPPCRATMEVFDNESGRTSVFAASFGSAANPEW